MTAKRSFRVFVTKHHGGLTSVVLLRRFRVLLDGPPPAAMAHELDDALARLAPQAARQERRVLGLLGLP